MTAAALTPRVRAMVVCDEAIPSDVEGGVFHLEGVRVQLTPRSFPYARNLCVFLLLGSSRRGTYPGWVRIVNSSGTTIRYKEFRAVFQEDNELLPLFVDMANCVFRVPEEHAFEVWFTAIDGEAAQKGELPFSLHEEEE